MSKSKKCRARGGAANCTNPNCPEKHDGFNRLLADFQQHLDRQVPFAGAEPQPTVVDEAGYYVPNAWQITRQAAMAESVIAPVVVTSDAATAATEAFADARTRRLNPTEHPEEFGMTPFADIALPAAEWSFYEATILQKDDGYYLSTDSGCSCPTPWESHTIDDFTGPMTAEQAAEELQSLHDTCDPADMSDYTRDSVRNAVVKLRAAQFVAANPEAHPFLVEEMFRLD